MSDLTQDSFSDFCFVFSLCAMGHLLCLVMHRSADFAWALKAIFLRRLFVFFFQVQVHGVSGYALARGIFC